jgi:predicted RNase H-like HicB family nuclease
VKVVRFDSANSLIRIGEDPAGQQVSGTLEVQMQIPVLVEQLKGNGYRARGTEPFAVSAKGATREEALAKLRTKIETRLKKGTELVGLEIGPPPNHWMEFAGMFKDDPWVDDWVKSMAEYRQEVEDNPGR